MSPRSATICRTKTRSTRSTAARVFCSRAARARCSHASGFGLLEEFAASPEEVALGKKYGDEADDLMTALHEVIGHGSGKLNPKLTHEPAFYLKEYFSTLEEARADLMALWNVWDPKLQASWAGFQPRRRQSHVLRRRARRAHAASPHSEGRHHRRRSRARPPVDRQLHPGQDRRHRGR